LETRRHDIWESTYKSCCSSDLWVLQPNPNPPKEIANRMFNYLALFETTDYAF